MDEYKAHKQAGTLDEFWRIILPAYIAKFPDDDVANPEPETCNPARTKSGKISKKRTPGQPKPLREVRFFANAVQVCV